MLRSSPLSVPTRVAIALAAFVAVPACSQDSGPGTEEDLVNALTRDETTFSQGEAECIANAVFTEYGDDEAAIQAITRTDDYETLTGDGEGSVEGFGEVFDNAIAACTGG